MAYKNTRTLENEVVLTERESDSREEVGREEDEKKKNKEREVKKK